MLYTNITINELYEAIKSIDINKSPGTDGLIKEFYDYFWNGNREQLFKSYQFSFKHGLLSIEKRRRVIRLILKKHKDLTQLKNWEPISLQNIDIKIVFLCLTRSLQKVLPIIIDYNQYKIVLLGII